MKKRTKQSQQRLNTLILLIAFTAILLIVSTYAWFSTQREVYLTGLEGTVNVARGLQISLDADSWSQTVDISNANIQAVSTAVTGITNQIVSEDDGLIPVSSDGTVGADDTTLPMIFGDYADGKLNEASLATEGTVGKYYAFDLFLMNTTSQESAQALSLDLSGSSVTATNSGTGLEYSVRVGFALATGTSAITSGLPEQATILTDTTGTTNGKIANVSIWEPNADKHISGIASMKKLISVPNSSSITWGTLSASDTAGTGYSYVTFGTDSLLPTYAIKRTKTGNIANIYRWLDTNNESVTLQNTVKTSSTATGETNLTTVANSNTNFNIAANAVSRIRVYVWLEGQDVDAQNAASFGGKLQVNLALTKPE